MEPSMMAMPPAHCRTRSAIPCPAETSNSYSTAPPATRKSHFPPSRLAWPRTVTLASLGVYPIRFTASRISPRGTVFPGFNSTTATPSAVRKLAVSTPSIFFRVLSTDWAQEVHSRPPTGCSTCRSSAPSGPAARITANRGGNEPGAAFHTAGGGGAQSGRDVGSARSVEAKRHHRVHGGLQGLRRIREAELRAAGPACGVGVRRDQDSGLGDESDLARRGATAGLRRGDSA